MVLECMTQVSADGMSDKDNVKKETPKDEPKTEAKERIYNIEGGANLPKTIETVDKDGKTQIVKVKLQIKKEQIYLQFQSLLQLMDSIQMVVITIKV